jgi:hypothetical protein
VNRSDETRVRGELAKEELVSLLGCKEGLRRQAERQRLVDMGKPAVPVLIELLTHKKRKVRWEAAKALGEIVDPAAAPALVRSLTDECAEIRWLAAEGLIALGEGALVPLLEGLVEHFDELHLRQGAHHVLHDLVRRYHVNQETISLLETLRSLQPTVTVPFAAQRALDSLTQRGRAIPMGGRRR